MRIIWLVIFTLVIFMPYTSMAAQDLGSKVIATVGNEKITQQDIDRLTSKVPQPFRKAFAQKALESLIDAKVFSSLAIEEGLDKTKEFKERLEQEKRKILADYFIEKRLSDDIKVTEKEIQKYYDTNKADFQSNEKVEIAQILVKSQKQAANIKAKLDKGASFEKIAKDQKVNVLAKSFSKWVERGRISKPLNDVVFKLKKGEISDIVKTGMGYHIVKILDKKVQSTKSFEDVKTVIENRLKIEKKANLKKQYRDKAKVKIVGQ